MVSLVSAAKWFLVVLFAFLLWSTVLVFSLLFSAQSVALDKNSWFAVLEKIDSYESFVPLATRQLEQNFSVGIGSAAPSAALDSLVRESFSREWLDAELKKMVSNYFDFVEGKTEEIDFSFSVREPKQKMVQSIMKNGVSSALLPLVEAEVQQLPDRFELVPAEKAGEFLLQQRALVSLVRQAVLLLAILALAFALAIAALLRNHSILLVFGIIFLVAGLLMLLASQALSSFIPGIANEIQSGLQAQFVSIGTIDFEPVLAAFLNPLVGQLLLFGIVETVLGIAGIGGYWFLRGQKKNAASD